ncbi:MAG: HEAT repeat domain-containing protein, partial [Bryobacteraceae bacterium]
MTLLLFLLAADPRIVNARLTTHAVAGLEREFGALVAAQTAPAWIGYAVPALPGQRHGGGCVPVGTVRLEGPGSMHILFRVSSGRVEKVQQYNPDCELDGGGRAFHWLTGVSPAASTRLLASLARDHSAISALAIHADPAADEELERLLAPPHSDSIREKAAFWLGNARGRRGFEALRRFLAAPATSERLREKAVFALMQSREPDAIPLVVATARKDASPRVRGQALFWLAHKAGQKESAVIREAVDSDPDVDVKKKAVQALSQI